MLVFGADLALIGMLISRNVAAQMASGE